MLIKLAPIITSLFLIASCRSPSTNPKVAIATPEGSMIAEIFIEEAPLSGTAFMRNVDEGVYNDGRSNFYRVVHMQNQPDNDVKIEVVQGGVDRNTGDTSVPYIPHETTLDTGLTHLDGSLSLARMEPGTANTEFSICIGPQPANDFGGGRSQDGQGFAVFGQVIKGMELARKIQHHPETNQYLNTPVKIISINRLD